MYAAVFYLLGFVGTVSAFVDMNCTSAGVLSPNAVVCADKYPPATCNAIYAARAPEIAPGAADERRGLCYGLTATATEFDAGMQKAAIATCPKTCGYCCMTPEYNCTNAPIPKMNCATITQDMCMSSAWREMIASECPSACGFCLAGGCVDAVPDCVTQFPAICNDPSMQTFVNVNCKKTCQRCAATTVGSIIATTRAVPFYNKTINIYLLGATAAPVTASTCADSRPQCAAWAANGYCTNAFYTADTIRTTCGRTCGRC